MSLKIRMTRAGAKKRPFFHIVIADSRSPRDGRFIEKVGHYNPMLPKDKAERVVLKTDRLKHWLSVGATPSDRVARFLHEAGMGPKVTWREQPKKSAPKAKRVEREKAQAEKAAAAAPAAADPAAEAPAAEASAG